MLSRNVPNIVIVELMKFRKNHENFYFVNFLEFDGSYLVFKKALLLICSYLGLGLYYTQSTRKL